MLSSAAFLVAAVGSAALVCVCCGLHIAAKAAQVLSAGIAVRSIWQSKAKGVSCVSLHSQQLTAVFLAIRACCALYTEGLATHIVLDVAALVGTVWLTYLVEKDSVINTTYLAVTSSFDSLRPELLLAPCAALALILHPTDVSYGFGMRVMWAMSEYAEAVSVLPQLMLIRNIGVVEKWTVHYISALATSRLLRLVDLASSEAYWGGVGLWSAVAIVSQLLQTLELVYVRRHIGGDAASSLPTHMAASGGGAVTAKSHYQSQWLV